MFLRKEQIQRLINKYIFSQNKSYWARYGFVFIITISFILTRTLAQVFLGKYISLHLALLGVMLSAWYGGLIPGVITTLSLGLINTYFFQTHNIRLGIAEDLILLVIFIIEGFFISLVSESLIRANMQKISFINFASHELKNPLASIRGFAEILNKKLVQKNFPKLAEYSSDIIEQSDRATNLINDLLDLNKIEGGKFTYRDESINILRFVKSIIENLRLVIKDHKIIFKTDLEKADIFVYGDKYRLSQTLINLVANAAKYSPKDSDIKVSLTSSKRRIRISVQDFGFGIERNNLHKIFNQHFREKRPSTSYIRGLGLGLYITQQIIYRHKGTVSVKSTPGKGSIFSIYLPIQFFN